MFPRLCTVGVKFRVYVLCIIKSVYVCNCAQVGAIDYGCVCMFCYRGVSWVYMHSRVRVWARITIPVTTPLLSHPLLLYRFGFALYGCCDVCGCWAERMCVCVIETGGVWGVCIAASDVVSVCGIG